MPNRIDTAEARTWLATLPGGEVSALMERHWHDFASSAKPVVTIYGAYDTGKSSLLRRLVVDAGEQAPEWLTISARHETFEVSELLVSGCLLRDTPGFVTGGHDARADMNSYLANEAVDLTDVAIVTVTPQLATAEYPVLQSLVKREWIAGSLWFVISRFDEAGIDPETDGDGYLQLAGRKTDELRRALQLNDDVPIFVVSQDFAQMAGSERNPDPDIWDDFRSWDGVAALSEALVDLSRQDITNLRDAAAQRFWRQSVVAALDGLRSEAVKYAEHAAFTDEGLQLRESWLTQLGVIERSAAADLRGRISETVGEAVDLERDANAFQLSLKSAIDLWYTDQERTIEQLLRSVDATIAIERERPSWRNLEELVADIRVEAERNSEPDGPEVITPVVQQVTKAGLTALVEYEKLSRPKKSSKSPAVDAMGVSRQVAVATAMVPLVVELSSIAEKLYRGNQAAEERIRARREFASQLDEVGADAVNMALAELKPLLDAAHQAITDATAERVEMRKGVADLLADLEVRIASGEALIKG